jgi:hypothetical protein
MTICVITVPEMGLCNRMKGVLSGMRLSQITGHTLGLMWPVGPSVTCQFEDLFDMQLEHLTSPDGCLPIQTWRFWVSKDEIPTGWAKAYPCPEFDGRAIDLEYNRIPQPVRAAYLQQIARLRPRQEIVQRAERITDGEFVSVHVRDGIDWKSWGRSVPLEGFFSAMDSLPQITRFFVSAQTPETLAILSDRYPGRVIQQEDKQSSSDGVRHMQNALVDLLCLSRGSELIGTFGSTFTEMAWWFGQCTQRVTIISGDQSGFRWF